MSIQSTHERISGLPTEETSRGVLKIGYGVHLEDLLPYADKSSSIASDRLTIYSIRWPGLNTREEIVVWPPLHGRELYSRELGISKADPGIEDVNADIAYITGPFGENLLRRHEEGLGELWNSFVGELPHLNKVYKTAHQDIPPLKAGSVVVLPSRGPLVVPIVRLQERNGIRGLVFHGADGASPIPADVSSDIRARVNRRGISVMPCQDSWLSGKVGIEMLIAAHFRSLKSIQDEWTPIWEKEKITYAQVMGKQPIEDPGIQFNGPVQASLIAVMAAVRYDKYFTYFFNKVRESVQ